MWAIVITWYPLSSSEVTAFSTLTFYISIFFTKTTRQINAKVNVNDGQFLIQKLQTCLNSNVVWITRWVSSWVIDTYSEKQVKFHEYAIIYCSVCCRNIFPSVLHLCMLVIMFLYFRSTIQYTEKMQFLLLKKSLRLLLLLNILVQVSYIIKYIGTGKLYN
jgi:hypothetical protein